MIFKTIQDSIDTTKTKLVLFNKDWNTYKNNWQSVSGLKNKLGSLFTSQTISSDDVNAIKAYNAQIDACVTSQTAFNKTMLQASPAAQNLVASCNGAKVAEEQLEIASKKVTVSMKATELGMKALSVAGNLIVFTAITKGIQLLCKGLDNLVHYEEKASEKANELFSKTSEKVRKNEDEIKSLDTLISKYKELKSSENFDVDKRQEVKNLQNDIADLVGTQAKNLDLVNGKLDEEIEKLNEISKKEVIRSYRDAQNNYYNAKDASNKAIGKDKVFFNYYDYAGKNEKGIKTILEEYGFYKESQTGNVSLGVTNDGIMGSQLVVSTRDLKSIQDKIDYLESIIDVLESNGQSGSEFYKGIVEAISNYDTYLREETNAANSLIDSWITYSQYSNKELSKIYVDSVESFEEYRQKMIDEAKNEESIGQILADGTLSEDALETAINDFMSTATQFSEWYEQWAGNVKGDTFNDKNLISSPSITETIDQLNTQLKPTFDSLKKAYQDIFTTDNNGNDIFTLENVDLSMLDDIKSKIDDINKNEDLGIHIDYSEFENLARVLTDTSSTADDVHDAFDKFATGIVNATTAMDGMTEETAQLVKKMLESLGVANAEEVAMNTLTEAKAEAFLASHNLADATEEDIAAMLNEAEAAGIATDMIFKLVAEQQVFSAQDLSTEGKVAKLKELADAYGQTAVAAKIARMEEEYTKSHMPINYGEISKAAAAEINNAVNNVHVNFNGTDKSKSSKSGSKKKEDDKWLEEYKKKLAELQNLLAKGRLMPSTVVIQYV